MISASLHDNGVANGLRDAATFLAIELPRELLGVGERLEAAVKRHAQGRPGPRRDTGAYVGSISLAARQAGGHYEVEVGTDAPQGRRLEYGYMGQRDRLGRVFHQAPYPHFRPAVREVLPQVDVMFERLLDGVRSRMS